MFDLPERAPGAAQLALPDTYPLIVEVHGGASVERVLLDLDEAAVAVRIVGQPVRVKSLFGEVFEIGDAARLSVSSARGIIDYSEEKERHRGFLGELPFDLDSLRDGRWTGLDGDNTTGTTSILWRCIELLEQRDQLVLYHFAHEAMPEWNDPVLAASSLAAQLVRQRPGVAGTEESPQQRLRGSVNRFLRDRGEGERLHVILGSPGGSSWVVHEMLRLFDPNSSPAGLVGLVDLSLSELGSEESLHRIDLRGEAAASLRERAIAQRFDVELLQDWLSRVVADDPREGGLPRELLEKLLPEIAPALQRLAGDDWWRAAFLADWLKAWVLSATEKSYTPELPSTIEHDELIRWMLRSDWLQDEAGRPAMSGLMVLAAAREALPMSELSEFEELVDRALPLLTAFNDRLTLRAGVRDVLTS